MNLDLYLASQSPRRCELLLQLGVRFEVRPANVPELAQPGESPNAFVQRLAMEKATAVWSSLDDGLRRPVLGADTVVCIEEHILGKPRDKQAGIDMLQLLSGRTHEVVTGVALVSQQHSVCVNVSKVTFKQLSRDEIERYWASKEPVDKAGGYAIQGYAAAFIAHLEGSYSGVMGLPLYETAQLLQSQHIPIWDEEK
jgi:septum formation protein